MSSNFVEVSGITPASHYPKCPPNLPCTQFCEIDKLCIPYPNPNIHDILEVCVNVVVCSTKEICTPIGRKLVIEGVKEIKVSFSTDDPCQSIHSAQFEIPFCTFIVLGDIKHEVKKVCTAVEYISVTCLDCRHLTVTSIIFVCPVLKKEPDCCPCSPQDNATYPCDCHDPCEPKSNYADHCDYHHPHNSQPTSKKYQYGSTCSSCGLSQTIRADQRHYYGR